VTGPVRADDVLVIVEGAHARRFDDELIVLDLKGGDYYALNEVAAAMWDGFAAGATPAQVAAQISETHAVDGERAMNDCLAFANELLARGLVLRKR
jgi:hypothetical protein